MARGDRTNTVRKANRRFGLFEMAKRYPDEAAHYLDIAERIRQQLIDSNVCIKCGRPTKNPMLYGYGPECWETLTEEEKIEEKSRDSSV